MKPISGAFPLIVMGEVKYHTVNNQHLLGPHILGALNTLGI